MQCLSFRAPSPSSTASYPTSPQTLDFQGTSADGTATATPTSSTQFSPTVNLTREYTLALQTNSYSEIWSRIQDFNASEHQVQDQIFIENGGSSTSTHLHLVLSQLLQPNRASVEEALRRHSKPNTLTRLVSTYFDHSENTVNLCLLLFQSMYRARDLYVPIHELLDVLPHDPDSLAQSQCETAFDVFSQFEQLDNPFPCPDSTDNFLEMRRCFSQLKQQLDHRLHKTRSRIRYLNRAGLGAAICLIGTLIAVPISAALIATHTLVAAIVAAVPFCVPCGLKKKEKSHIAQLDAASKGAYVLNEDLRTINCLVDSLYNTVEGDKLFVQFGLERGRDKFAIHEVVKQLRKNRVKFSEQLAELEVHLCLCFSAVNKARSLLLREIDPQED